MIDSRTAPYAALLLRVSLGALFLAHAGLKFFVFTPAGTAKFFASVGMGDFHRARPGRILLHQSAWRLGIPGVLGRRVDRASLARRRRLRAGLAACKFLRERAAHRRALALNVGFAGTPSLAAVPRSSISEFRQASARNSPCAPR